MPGKRVQPYSKSRVAATQPIAKEFAAELLCRRYAAERRFLMASGDFIPGYSQVVANATANLATSEREMTVAQFESMASSYLRHDALVLETHLPQTNCPPGVFIMSRRLPFYTMLVVGLLALRLTSPLLAKGPAYTDPDKTDADFPFQGEYVGEIAHDSGDKTRSGVQVIALGGGKFHAVGYIGGLPGDGWDGKDKHESDGELKDGKVEFAHDKAKGTIKDGVMTVSVDDKPLGELKKVVRESPTLGAKPPAGAIVLFDGKSTDALEGGKLTADGLLSEGCTSKQKFNNYTLHVEFRLPFMPEDRGQGRGNSGVYMQGRYEVQVLDSFGLKGENNECGAIYTIRAPTVNMCFPPLTWQTYDVDYTAAEYADGKKVKNAKITVKHNGVLVQEDVEATHATTAAPNKENADPGPIYFQNHGNPVRYRNIWLVEKK